MALDDVAHQGKDGIVKIGATPTVVALLTSWSYEESVDEYEKTAMTDAGKSYFGGIPEGTGSIECWWAEADGGQGAVYTEMDLGTGIDLEIYPDGTTTATDFYYSGNVIIKSYTVSADKDGIVTFAFTFRGTLDFAAVPA